MSCRLLSLAAVVFCHGIPWNPAAAQPAATAGPRTAAATAAADDQTALGLGTSGFVQSGDVRLHYVTRGTGPLVILIHGFPDFWYTWRHQMTALSTQFQVVAYDQRGYNLSDQPEGVADYHLDRLVDDTAAVLRHFQRERAVIVGHDWGGMVAWSFAMRHPELTERLVILNLPHPRGLLRELAQNPAQQASSAYARLFQQPEAAAGLTAEGLATWVQDPAARAQYVTAFRRSSFAGMLNYYKANYPRPPYTAPVPDLPQVRCPVLMFHGLQDKALLSPALNGTWDWVDNELTLITIPEAGHFVQHDAADRVTRIMQDWLQPLVATPRP